jgi:Domain of unknown function (DUF1963)
MFHSIPMTHVHLVFSRLHPTLKLHGTPPKERMKPVRRLRCHQVDTTSRGATHIGDYTPSIQVEISWPHCVVCGNPLSFVWQLNFADFDANTFEHQVLFQFFYCSLCFPLPPDRYKFEALCRWDSDFKNNERRSVAQVPSLYFDELSPGERQLARLRQVEINLFLALSLTTNDDNLVWEHVLDQWRRAEGKSYYELCNEILGLSPNVCFCQVCGSPDWIQRHDTPHCPVCGQRAELVGAIGSDKTNLIWGDIGISILLPAN